MGKAISVNAPMYYYHKVSSAGLWNTITFIASIVWSFLLKKHETTTITNI